MLIKNDNYKINKKTGDIVKRQEVLVKCDECGREWKTLYDYRKRKKLKKDLCKSCRSKFNLRCQEPLNKRRWSKIDSRVNIICSFCQKGIKRYPSLINIGNNFCDISCRDKFILGKYDILYKTFKKYVDEVAYLFGIILGDGHLRKMGQKNTTRIDIAFNAKEIDMIDLARDVMNKLNIDYYPQKQKGCNCLHLGFVLPDRLLKKYNMLWQGSKYRHQPRPIDKVVNNINFVAGLINSDGWCGFVKNRKNTKRIIFCNTVSSIVNVFNRSLELNQIDYTICYRDGALDKRTNKINKEQWIVSICKKASINNLISKCSYSLKEF